MIINTKTGCMVTGTLTKDAELKFIGEKGTPLLTMSVLYGHDPAENEGGRRPGKFLDVKVWGNAGKQLEDALHKGDAIIAAGELDSRTDKDGKVWTSLNSHGEIWLGCGAMLAMLDSMARFSASPAQSCVVNPADSASDASFAVIDDNEDLPF